MTKTLLAIAIRYLDRTNRVFVQFYAALINMPFEVLASIPSKYVIVIKTVD